MRCIAIDDEPIALTIIEQFCQRLGGLDLKSFSDPVLGMDKVYEINPDILFLDIEMNGISGLDIAKKLPKSTFLVFTTAYAEFALDGFELNAVDFLHKPFSFDRFRKSVEKVFELKSLHEKSIALEESNSDEIVVKVEYHNVRVRLAAIQYIEAMDNYIKIHIYDGRPILSQMSMKMIGDMLPSDKFMRIHKSYIVSIGNIEKYTRNKVVLKYKSVELPVGRVYAGSFIKIMNK